MDDMDSRVEEGCKAGWNNDLSVAISLKRIADALEKLAKPVVMPELTPEQLEEWEKANQNAGFVKAMIKIEL